MYILSSKRVGSAREGLLEVTDIPTPGKEEYCSEKAHLTELEQQQLAAWNTTLQDYSHDFCIPQLVARQASATPEAIALIADHQMLTYKEINQQANQLAHCLQRLGVLPNMLVGICVERSFDMVVGLLGILKAGGAYVPMDPSYPPDRLKFMVEDAHVPIVLTHQHLSERFASDKVQIICLDSDAALLARQSIIDLPATSRINDLVYVIYTSGSTGQPKGVQITHDSLLNLVFWHQRAFNVTSSDRATQVASPAFDATGWELWPYLTIGASVYLTDEDTRVSPRLLRDWLVEQEITITFLPTPLAESVIALEWPSRTSLRLLLTGADTLHHYPLPTLPFAVINNYGPTEATVVATSGRVPPIINADKPPSIGRPIANTQVYILDEYLQRVPFGEPGELYIGGAGLAKGYLSRPDLTTERFIPNPFNPEPDARLYKTGDLARFLPDGQLAFLGRNDHQIKIRGYRIEPAEIVAVLNTHPAVRTSLIVACEDIPGDKRLVAYIVPVPGAQVTADSLRDILLTHLPDYMVPMTFVRLAALPLTPNGKVDRDALPAPDTTNTIHDRSTNPPGTPLEKQLAGIVAALLGMEQVGIDDNFFMLGGHSLLGTQVISQVEATFGINLPLLSLFEAPTIRQLSIEIEQGILARIESMSEEEAVRMLAQEQNISHH